MKSILGVIMASIVLAGLQAQSALALPEFKKPFGEKYAAKHKSADFKKAVKSASCNVCHVKGAKKTVRNEYGDFLAKLIEGSAAERKKKAKADGGTEGQNKEKAKILEELEKAMVKIEKQKSDGGKGPEFGKLIESGKIPVDIDKAVAKYKADKAKADKKQ